VKGEREKEKKGRGAVKARHVRGRVKEGKDGDKPFTSPFDGE
jgi:hypothetical protein